MRSLGKWWTLAAIGVFWCGSLASAAAAADDDAQAKQILQTAGLKTGLCIHLGCGSQPAPALTAALAANSDMLVHGLALDEAALLRARKAIETRNLAGRAAVEKVPLCPLPYVRDLANLAVIEDFDALAAQGVTSDEVERVVAPGGVICTRKDGRWTKTLKPRPKEMDDWTHPAHGPDGNRVSTDRLVRFPVGLRWLDGVPMNFNMWAACRGWVIANGRCFTLSTTEFENLGPASFSKHKQEEYVAARDAFNGLPLWKVNCETTNDGKWLNHLNAAPLATDGQRVYAFKTDQVVALDAATGQVVARFPVKYPTARLALAGSVLISAGWEGREEGKGGKATGLWAPWVMKGTAGAVEAFDVQQGKPKWSVPSAALDLVAADAQAYLLLQSGNPATEQEILAVDLQTGQQRWRIPHSKFAPEPGLHLGFAGAGVLVVGRPKAKAISVLAAKDGNVLWEIKPTEQFWTPFVDGLLWHNNKKYDPKTGEVKGTLPGGVNSGGCTPSAIVGDYVTASRGCGYTEFCWEDGKPKGANHISWRGIRGGCIQGATPAHGMFYTGQNFCRCAPGQVPGFVGFGPCGEVPTASDFEKQRPLEKGPAYGQAKAAAASAINWPMHRHDAQRSGFAKVKLPEKLKVAWQAEVARPAEGPLAAAWKARLASCLTAPVVAEGLVITVATDAGQVVAVEAASGKPAWRFTAGSRIDSPPTLARGLCLFGCHDGWLYALRATDGQLAWRTRLAPWERRMVAFGQVESVWPVIGSVLPQENLVYASAGRTSESDGGLALCALEVDTGKQLWAKQLAPGPTRQNDLLVATDGKLLLHHIEIDPKSGQNAAPPKSPGSASLEGIIDGSWTRLGTRRSGNQKIGPAAAEMFVFNDQTVFGYESRSRSCYALPRAKTTGTDKLKPDDYSWRLSLPPGHQVEAMALGENGLVLSGRVCDPQSDKPSGFLWIVSPSDGKKISELSLAAPPAYDGLAIAEGRVYLSLQDGQVLCLTKAE